MDKLVKFLKEGNFHKNVIISDTNEKGEGEFKILDYISINKLNNFIIYSPDADLIILSMIIWSNFKNINLKILRYDQNTEILNIIYINQLIDYLIDYIEDRINKKIDNYKYIKDLTFIFTLFGNDFLPRIEEININMDFYLVLDAYIINYVDHDYIMNDKLDIIPHSFFKYLSFLNKYSSYLLERNKQLYKYQNFNYAQTNNLQLDIKNNKYNPAMIFYIEFHVNNPENTKYGKLEYYFYDNNKLKKIKDFQYKNNFK
jgi:5'-3' exonuclease